MRWHAISTYLVAVTGQHSRILEEDEAYAAKTTNSSMLHQKSNPIPTQAPPGTGNVGDTPFAESNNVACTQVILQPSDGNPPFIGRTMENTFPGLSTNMMKIPAGSGFGPDPVGFKFNFKYVICSMVLIARGCTLQCTLLWIGMSTTT